MKSDKELFIIARKLIEDPANWIKEGRHINSCEADCKIKSHVSNTVNGLTINFHMSNACDVNKAIKIACKQNESSDRYGIMFWKMNNLISDHPYIDQMNSYNDSHYHEEILAWFDLAISLSLDNDDKIKIDLKKRVESEDEKHNRQILPMIWAKDDLPIVQRQLETVLKELARLLPEDQYNEYIIKNNITSCDYKSLYKNRLDRLSNRF